MDQRSRSKIKLFRTLKVAYYCLGLPLFVVAVLATAWTFLGYTPFSNYGGGALTFKSAIGIITSPAMVSVWVALGIWAVIAVVQIILSFTVKNSRARTLVISVVMLVVMLGPVLIMDAVFTSKLNTIAAEAYTGVTVADYKTQLSTYHPKSSGASNSTKDFVETVNNFNRIFNVEMKSDNKAASANNTADTPVYYDELYIDYNDDGVVDILDHKLVKEAPNADGKLVINGVVYENYRPKAYSQKVATSRNSTETANPTRYIWYNTSKSPTLKDGPFGEAPYNENGTLADGYVFSTETALEILYQYHYAQTTLKAMLGSSYDSTYATLKAEAQQRQAEYYSSTEELERIWNDEIKLSERFTLTQGELNNLLNVLGSEILGSDLILNLIGTVESILGMFDVGIDLSHLDLGELTGMDQFKDVIISITTEDQLRINIKGGAFGAEGMSLTIDEHILDNVQILLQKVLEIFGVDASLIDTILGVVNMLGILPFDLSLDNLADSVMDYLMNDLLGGLYWFHSPIILPVYEFYADEYADEEEKLIADLFRQMDRAYYEGSLHGYMIGSRLLGGSLGDGSYTGEASFAEVAQLRTDLQYKVTFYSYFNVRDKLLLMTPFVLFFMILSCFYAEKQRNFELGIEKTRERKKKDKDGKSSADVYHDESQKGKGKKKGKNSEGASDVKNDAYGEDTAFNVYENTQKEVL